MSRFFTSQVSIVFSIALATLIIACSDASFQNNTGIIKEKQKTQMSAFPQGAEAAPIPEVPSNILTEEFQVQLMKNNLDLIWVIDNSGSMSNEIEQVRINFSNFIQTAQNFSNLKLALISADTASRGQLGIDLPEAILNENFIQVNQAVGSYDSLDLLSRNLLEANGLGSFLRRNAHKAFVFVTDDDSIFLSSDDFASLIIGANGPIYDKKNVSIYSFSGLASSNCPIARVGMQYINLKELFTGKNFDICQLNWDQHFKELTQSLEDSLMREFTLTEKVAEIEVIKVALSGNELSKEHYEIIGGNKIVLSEDTKISSGDKLVVQYLLKDTAEEEEEAILSKLEE